MVSMPAPSCLPARAQVWVQRRTGGPHPLQAQQEAQVAQRQQAVSVGSQVGQHVLPQLRPRRVGKGESQVAGVEGPWAVALLLLVERGLVHACQGGAWAWVEAAP